MESYSKALNAGQYPLSVLALSKSCALAYQRGLYGNTMTSNPRAMDIGVAVLASLSDGLRDNIRARGRELLAKFVALADDIDGAVVSTNLSLTSRDRRSWRAHPAKDHVRIGRNTRHRPTSGHRLLRHAD